MHTRREIGRLQIWDYFLSAVSSILAVYSVAQGIKIPMALWVFGGLILIGTGVSAILNRIIPTRFQWIGGALYFIAAIAAIWAMEPLNTIFPDEGFPRVLLLAGGLSWMMAFGSFFLWGESTLTFQAIPAIALFGLVGAWDTFSGAPFAFFGFLLCFATLFSRSNARTMMRQAQDAGYGIQIVDASIVSGAVRRRETDENRLLASLKSGPWRFMAGPEWALGSALVIVLLSLLGAPVIQASMQGVVGNVRFNPSTARSILPPVTEALNSISGQTIVGQGPRPMLQKRPVFTVRNGVVGYYRLASYTDFTGRGWREQPGYQNVVADPIRDMRDSKSLLARSLDFSKNNLTNITYRIELQQALNRAPILGTPNPMQLPNGYNLRPDGTVNWPSERNQATIGSWVLPANINPTNVARNLPLSFYGGTSNQSTTNRVRQFALGIVEGKTSDYEKALALKTAIGQRIKYDLMAPAVPAGNDPVDFVLFESKTGYCDLFASALVICARVAGLPARYATGYYPALLDQEGDQLRLNESEAHAWAEIYFEGYGWIPFDSTEDAEGSTERGDPTYRESFFEKAWVRTTALTIGMVILVGGIWFLAKLIRRPAASLDPGRLEAAVGYRELARTLEKATGRPKRPNQTPSEYLEMVRPQLGTHFEEVEAISRRLAYGLFARTPLGSEEVQSLRRQIRELRSRLRK